MRISTLVACSNNGVIGRKGQLPWKLSGDLQYFKQLTMGHPILMGRKTLAAIGRLLPGRTTIVLTRDTEFQFTGAVVVHSWQEACQRAADFLPANEESELFVVGGGQIYRLSLPFVKRIYLTRVHADVVGDTFFPKLDDADWNIINREDHLADERNDYDYSFVVMDRIQQSKTASGETGNTKSRNKE